MEAGGTAGFAEEKQVMGKGPRTPLEDREHCPVEPHPDPRPCYFLKSEHHGALSLSRFLSTCSSREVIPTCAKGYVSQELGEFKPSPSPSMPSGT